MKRVFLIRHGLPEFPGGQRQCIGSTDIPLSAAGFAQAAEMASAWAAVSLPQAALARAQASFR